MPIQESIAFYLYVVMIAAGLTTLLVASMFVEYLKAERMIYCFAILASLKEYTQIRKEDSLCAE